MATRVGAKQHIDRLAVLKLRNGKRRLQFTFDPVHQRIDERVTASGGASMVIAKRIATAIEWSPGCHVRTSIH